MHLPFNPCGEFDGTEFFPMFIEQYRNIAGLEGFQYQFPSTVLPTTNNVNFMFFNQVLICSFCKDMN